MSDSPKKPEKLEEVLETAASGSIAEEITQAAAKKAAPAKKAEPAKTTKAAPKTAKAPAKTTKAAPGPKAKVAETGKVAVKAASEEAVKTAKPAGETAAAERAKPAPKTEKSAPKTGEAEVKAAPVLKKEKAKAKAEPAAPEAKAAVPDSDFKKKIWEPLLRPIVTLVVVCLLASGLLGITNQVTLPKIEENKSLAADMARKELLPDAGDSGFINLALKGEPANVTSIYKAGDGAGYVVEAYGIGYGGRVPVMVGFNAEGSITGVKFLENNETPGLGKKLNTDPKFSAQFAGHSNERILPNDVDAIPSATISTGAALTGINAAISYYNTAILGIKDGEMTFEEMLASLLPGAGSINEIAASGENITGAYQGDDGNYIVIATGKGFDSDVTAAVALDPSGTILSIWLDTKGESAGYGREVAANKPYLDQFADKTSADGVDKVAGASVTSKAVASAVDTAIAYFHSSVSGSGGGQAGGSSNAGSSSSSAPSAGKPTPEEIRAQLLPGAGTIDKLDIQVDGVTEAYKGGDGNYIIYAKSEGYESNITAAVAMDAEGVILGLWLDTSKETGGFGRDIADNNDYIASFIGENSADGVNGVAGASFTSKAVAKAVNAALAALPQVKEAS